MKRMVSWQKHEGGRRKGKRGHKHNCAAVALAILTGMPYTEARGLVFGSVWPNGYLNAGMTREELPGRSNTHCTLEQARDAYGDCVVIMQWWGKRRMHADALVKGKLRGPWNFLERRSKPKVVQIWTLTGKSATEARG